MRRAVAIQLIINRELGLNKNQNPWQGSFVIERADRPGRRGGLQGVRSRSPSAAACWAPWRPCTSAARSRKSRCYYEHTKHDGILPIVGVNTFLPEHGSGDEITERRAVPLHAKRRSAAQVDAVRASNACTQRRRPAALQTTAGRGRDRRQRLRGADGDRAGLLARPDHRARSTTSAASTAATCS